MRIFSDIENWIVRSLTQIGDFMITSGLVLAACFTPPWRIWLTIQQMEFVGVGSLLIIILMSMFAGGVFTLQTVYALSMFSMESMVGATVALALTRELSPVLSALMITGRAGSAMATELGTMRVTEQIDALESMAVNPLQYLFVPRLIASLFMFPVLTMVSNLVGMVGSYIVGVIMWGIDPGNFIEKIRWYVTAHDIYSGLIKSIVFGGVVTLISCYKGYRAEGGARGVGVATTQAVVISSVSIMILDYFLTVLMF